MTEMSPKRNSIGRLSIASDGDLRILEVNALVNDLDGEIQELERTVVYWQTLFDESQKEASALRSRIRELETLLSSAYSEAEERPRYFEDSEVAKDAGLRSETGSGKGWTFFGAVSQLVNRTN